MHYPKLPPSYEFLVPHVCKASDNLNSGRLVRRTWGLGLEFGAVVAPFSGAVREGF